MKLSVSANTETLKDGGCGLNFIATEGIYPVTMNFVSVADTKNGAKTVNFNFNYNDNAQTVYGPVIINKDGRTNEIGMSLINKLAVVVGLQDGHDFDIREETHKVGKDNKEQAFEVITEFSGEAMFLHVVREYSKYNGEIRRSLTIRNAFRASDFASAAEVAAGKDAGKQYELTLEKYNKPVYRDGVTAEEAEAFEAAAEAERKSGKSAPAPTSATVAKKESVFAKR